MKFGLKFTCTKPNTASFPENRKIGRTLLHFSLQLTVNATVTEELVLHTDMALFLKC